MNRWNDWDDGKSTWVTSALMFVMAVIVLLFCGCRGYYYVVPSDRELVRVAHQAGDKVKYIFGAGGK